MVLKKYYIFQSLLELNKISKMGSKETFVDYYQILKCNRNATEEELKKSYQQLVLLNHPDKIGYGNEEKFRQVQNAWSVLRDPQSRRQYDAMLMCYESDDLLLYNTISLSDMELNSTENVYMYECRCSGIYYLDMSELFTPQVIINCNECSFSIQVNIRE
ncbi:unnamed protein product, partial [Brenthis ino]